MFEVDEACRNLIGITKLYGILGVMGVVYSVTKALEVGGQFLGIAIGLAFVFLPLIVVVTMCSISVLDYIHEDFKAKQKAKSEAAEKAV